MLICRLHLILSAVAALSLVSNSARGGDEDPRAVVEAQKIIDTHRKNILYFACPNAPGLKKVTFDGYRNLKDGYELTFTFKWDHFFEYYIRFTFSCDTNGVFDSVGVKDHNLSGEPFGSWEVNERNLAKMRQFMKEHPKVKDNRKLLATVEDANAKRLCELFLKLQQGRE